MLRVLIRHCMRNMQEGLCSSSFQTAVQTHDACKSTHTLTAFPLFLSLSRCSHILSWKAEKSACVRARQGEGGWGRQRGRGRCKGEESGFTSVAGWTLKRDRGSKTISSQNEQSFDFKPLKKKDAADLKFILEWTIRRPGSMAESDDDSALNE